ncbi:hypothetical protein [Proteiniclasticum sp. QWL-01]|uniref:hypothetical protein n=1 Tax=Proteiniclasticum sp. QWL-01 TaxID=3036945 RepID=UPI002410C591|nr:hypothetical protein [Proteiniclasticum sp. QWL-01]WFF73558.1 hypothetical protein P6M73_03665 [Proteiniclasticum sp. QWL-01]
MFENMMQKTELPLIIVCDDKDVVFANYLIQLIGQKDDKDEKIVGIADDSVSAAIYTTKFYNGNLPQIPSTQHILFIGHSKEAKEQRQSIQDKYEKLGMHYGWLGKRAVLYVDESSGDWLKLKDDRKHYDEFLEYSEAYGVTHPDALHGYAKKLNGKIAKMMPVFVGAPKMLIDRNAAASEIKAQQYRTLEKVFYDEGLRLFMEG